LNINGDLAAAGSNWTAESISEAINATKSRPVLEIDGTFMMLLID
jgi:hypothetical protein